MAFDYDLFVIGAGSGGVRAGRIAAGHGARVAVAEERALGGTCVNVGCIPKKLFVYASHFGEDFEDAAGFGWSLGTRAFDWGALIRNKDREIARLNRIYGELLDKAGATRIEGRARLLDPHTVEVAGRRLTAANVLIATGGWPVAPAIPGGELALSSNEMFHLESLPKRWLVVGGGYIAVEFAGILHGLGCEVIQIYRGPLFLRGFDDDLRTHLAGEMRKKGIDLRFDRNLVRIEAAGGRRRVTLSDDSQLEVDAVLAAIGRHPLSADLGLEQAGVRLRDNGAIVVDEYGRTSVPHIWAVGDVTDRVNLTPVAIREGHAVADTLFGNRPTRVDHADIPTAVFSQPPIGTVGLTEAQAREVHGEVRVFRTSFRPLKHTVSGRDERTLMKLVVETRGDRVVGCHMVGADAPEIAQCLAIAIKAGATKAHFDATIGVHPTAAEEFVTMRS